MSSLYSLLFSPMQFASNRCAWEGNIKTEPKEMAWEVADKIYLVHHRD